MYLCLLEVLWKPWLNVVVLGHCTGQWSIPQGPQSVKRPDQTLWTILQNSLLKTSALTFIINIDIFLSTVLCSILYLHYLHVESFGISSLCTLSPHLQLSDIQEKSAKGVWSASTMASLYRKEEFLLQLSGLVLYLRSRRLFHAILTLSQPLISGLPHPPAARDHPTDSFSGKLSLLCPRNDKAHVKTVNGESNPNPKNSLSSKTTSVDQALCNGCVHMKE